MAEKITLTQVQKDKARELFASCPDLIKLTQRVFENESLDGRSKEGRALKKFLGKENLRYKTTKYTKQDSIEFTDEQKQFIIQQARDGLSSLRIAELIFPDRSLQALGMEARGVLECIRDKAPEFQHAEETGMYVKYQVPRSVERAIQKVNSATGGEINKDKLSRPQRICLERLIVNLSNSRFIKIATSYTSVTDRALFEDEFIRMTWDKPDLTADEVNLYMNACKEIINLETISRHLNKLNTMFDETGEQADMSMRLAEIIKAKSGEYHQCEGRVESLIKKLQGDRSNRISAKQKDNASILAIVQLFQDEDERKNMVRIAEAQKKLVNEEADVLESLPEWKARILGISRDDAI